MGGLSFVDLGEKVILKERFITLFKFSVHCRQGSWKTGEKETGTSEESKKLEENNHTV